MWIQRNKIFASIFALTTSCHYFTQEREENLNTTNHLNIESHMLVCRLGNGLFSGYFKKFGSKEQKYSHIGIVSRENDTAFVYHVEASELSGQGIVKRELLSNFLKSSRKYDFFQFSFEESIKSSILGAVKEYYTRSTPFDLEFDSFSDDKLYCTELIAVSINKGLKKSEIVPTLNINGKQIYSLDDIYLNPNLIKIICDSSQTPISPH